MSEADSTQENNQSQPLPDASDLIESILAAAMDATEQDLIDAAIASEKLEVSDATEQETIETIVVDFTKATENNTSDAIAADNLKVSSETVADPNTEEIRSEARQIVNDVGLSDLEDTSQNWEPERTREFEGAISANVASSASTVVADSTNLVATNEATVQLPVSEADWLALIQKLRSRNRGLLNRVTQLEKGLEECQEVIESHRQKARSQETIILEQTSELDTSQEQLTRTFRELELSHQVAQRQQILIETLTEQLESSQERIAQMERECAYTVQRCNDQTHALLQSETTVRELRDRLQRQQRHTLQFKTALEKCLEMPGTNSDGNPEIAGSPSQSLSQRRYIQNMLAAKALIPKAQPIQPWSAQPSASSEENDNLEDSTWTNSEEVEPDHSDRSCELDWIDAVLDADDNPADQKAEEVDSELLASEPELATIFQMIDDLNEDLPLTPATQRSNAFSISSDSETIPSSARTFESYVNPAEDVPLTVSTQPEGVGSAQDLDADSESDREPSSYAQAILSQPNWPSPVLYPQRPSKGLKSLAAVELPTFPKKNGG